MQHQSDGIEQALKGTWLLSHLAQKDEKAAA
jgi:hypothetical protein